MLGRPCFSKFPDLCSTLSLRPSLLEAPFAWRINGWTRLSTSTRLWSCWWCIASFVSRTSYQMLQLGRVLDLCAKVSSFFTFFSTCPFWLETISSTWNCVTRDGPCSVSMQKSEPWKTKYCKRSFDINVSFNTLNRTKRFKKKRISSGFIL